MDYTKAPVGHSHVMQYCELYSYYSGGYSNKPYVWQNIKAMVRGQTVQARVYEQSTTGRQGAHFLPNKYLHCTHPLL